MYFLGGGERGLKKSIFRLLRSPNDGKL